MDDGVLGHSSPRRQKLEIVILPQQQHGQSVDVLDDHKGGR
jgi:hypothetical protein